MILLSKAKVKVSVNRCMQVFCVVHSNLSLHSYVVHSVRAVLVVGWVEVVERRAPISCAFPFKMMLSLCIGCCACFASDSDIYIESESGKCLFTFC